MPEAGARLALAGPNPSRAGTALAFTAAAGDEVRLALYDVLGRRVAVLFEGSALGQEQVVRVESGLAPGVYVARLEGAGAALARRLVLLP